jgi:hypothetical protein
VHNLLQRNSRFAAGGKCLARLDEVVVEEAHLPAGLAAIPVQAEVKELMLLSQICSRIRRRHDVERILRRRRELHDRTHSQQPLTSVSFQAKKRTCARFRSMVAIPA